MHIICSSLLRFQVFFTPRIHRIVNETQDDKETQRVQLTELFTRVGRVQFFDTCPDCDRDYLFWTSVYFGITGLGRDMKILICYIIAYNSGFYSFDSKYSDIEIQRAMNIHQFRSVIYAVMAIVNLMLSIYLCQIYGAVGSAIGTAISLILANGFYHEHLLSEEVQY